MQVELFNAAKYRNSRREGDDVALILPGQLYAVCDGATDPLGTVVGGIGAGRVAALAMARAVQRLSLTPEALTAPIDEILATLSRDLAAATRPMGLEIPPSTTLALAIDLGEDWRFITLGDSGIRLNGTEVLRHEKIIDDVSAAARVQYFLDRLAVQDEEDQAEVEAREGMLLGLDLACKKGRLSAARLEDIIAQTVAETELEDHAQEVEAFLRAGIRSQYKLGNLAGHPLGFDTLNGTLPCRGEWQDRTVPKAKISSIEIFSDGYCALPPNIGVAAFEASFAEVEALDYHKTGAFRSVKGSTKAQVFDDRTILAIT